MKTPVRVAVTGAAGQIGYSLLFRIAAGDMLGTDQPVILQLLEIPDEKAQKALKGVMMELDDCAFPLLAGMVATDRRRRLQGHRRRAAGRRPAARPGHGAQGPADGEREDLHRAGPGAERGRPAAVKVLVVGNPANTNAYIAMKKRAEPAAQLHRDDAARPQPRAVAGRRQAGKPVGHREAHRLGQSLPDHVSRTASPRSAARSCGRSSTTRPGLETPSFRPCASAAPRSSRRAACPPPPPRPMRRSTTCATGSSAPAGDWVTMGVPSDGSYGIPEGVIYGYPVTCAGGTLSRWSRASRSARSAAPGWTPRSRNCSRNATRFTLLG